MRAQAFPGENPAQNQPQRHHANLPILIGPDSLGMTGQRFKAQ